MNKYQKALDRLIGITHNFPFKDWQKNNNKEMNDLLQELVDKETPMKPIEGEVFKVHDCPTCDDGYIEVDGYYKLNRCVNCGQRIDWADVRKMEEEERE